MADFEALMWWGLRDVRDRYLRLLTALDEFKATATREGKRVFELAKKPLLQELEEFEHDVRSLDPAGLARAAARGQNEAALLALHSYRRTYQLTTSRLFPYLPLGAHPPDDLRHFLSRALGLSLLNDEDQQRFSLAYSGKPFWEVAELLPLDDTSVTGGARVAVIPVPFTETLTPLRWPLLVHELAHAVIGPAEISELAAALAAATIPGLPEEGPLDELAEELLADAAAERACGPAYEWAFATETMFFMRSEAGHLRTPVEQDARTRCALLGSGLGLMPSTLPSQLDVTITDEISAAISGSIVKALTADGVNVVSADQMAQDTLIELRGNAKIDHRPVLPDVVADDPVLTRTLREAIAGHCAPPDEVRKSVIAELVAELAGAPAPAVVDPTLSQRFAHIHVSDAEILTAAWEFYANETAEQQEQAFWAETVLEGATFDLDRMSEAQSRVVRFDTYVARSLESAAVHRWLVEYLPT